MRLDWIGRVVVSLSLSGVAACALEQGETVGEQSQRLEGGLTLGAFENAVWYYDLSGDGLYGAGDSSTFGANPPAFGAATDIALAGYGDVGNCGSGGGGIGTYRPSSRQFFLDVNGNGQWNGSSVDRQIDNFMPAAAGFRDQPIIWVKALTSGEFPQCRGVVGFFRTPTTPGAGSWYIDRNDNGTWDGTAIDLKIDWGSTGDIAAPLMRSGLNRSRAAVFRPSTAQWFIDDGDNAWESCLIDWCPFYGATSSAAFANPNSCEFGTASGTSTWVDTDCDGIPESDESFTWGLSTSQRFLF